MREMTQGRGRASDMPYYGRLSLRASLIDNDARTDIVVAAIIARHGICHAADAW